MNLGILFEKFSAFLFLILLVGMVAFLVYIPMPAASEKVILIIIGGLMTTATGALPRLFGSDESKEKELQQKIESIGRRYEELHAEYLTIKEQYDRMVLLLIKKYPMRELYFNDKIEEVIAPNV